MLQFDEFFRETLVKAIAMIFKHCDSQKPSRFLYSLLSLIDSICQSLQTLFCDFLKTLVYQSYVILAESG